MDVIDFKSAESVINELKKGPRIITFEKIDGTIRVMKCTLDPTLIMAPPAKAESVNAPSVRSGSVQLPSTIAVWDLEANAWRAFRLSSLLTMGGEEWLQQS